MVLGLLFLIGVAQGALQNARWGEYPFLNASIALFPPVASANISFQSRDQLSLQNLGLSCAGDDGCGDAACHGSFVKSSLPATTQATFLTKFWGSTSKGSFALYAGNFVDASPRNVEFVPQATGALFWIVQTLPEGIALTLMENSGSVPLLKLTSMSIASYVC